MTFPVGVNGNACRGGAWPKVGRGLKPHDLLLVAVCVSASGWTGRLPRHFRADGRPLAPLVWGPSTGAVLAPPARFSTASQSATPLLTSSPCPHAGGAAPQQGMSKEGRGDRFAPLFLLRIGF